MVFDMFNLEARFCSPEGCEGIGNGVDVKGAFGEESNCNGEFRAGLFFL